MLVTSSDSLSLSSTSCCLRVQCESFVSYKFIQFFLTSYCTKVQCESVHVSYKFRQFV